MPLPGDVRSQVGTDGLNSHIPIQRGPLLSRFFVGVIDNGLDIFQVVRETGIGCLSKFGFVAGGKFVGFCPE